MSIRFVWLFFQYLEVGVLLFPERQFLLIAHRDDRSAIQPHLDVGLQFFFSLFSGHDAVV